MKVPGLRSPAGREGKRLNNVTLQRSNSRLARSFLLSSGSRSALLARSDLIPASPLIRLPSRPEPVESGWKPGGA
ncbi:hypothetical protein SRHO_G00121460 [Serrasalmus rhombeus]